MQRRLVIVGVGIRSGLCFTLLCIPALTCACGRAANVTGIEQEGKDYSIGRVARGSSPIWKIWAQIGVERFIIFQKSESGFHVFKRHFFTS